jgi:pyridoxamine 5'-phosphate oxidase
MFRLIKRWLPSREELSKPGTLLGQSITLMRREFSGVPFDEHIADKDPVQQFEIWFTEAVKNVKEDPNAMTLSTVGKNNRPSARIVLLKEYGADGFIFYTNYGSRKGKELEQNPGACLSFYWPELIRQVRIEGAVEKVSEEKSAGYFALRPRASQLGAWASAQSSEISSREELETYYKQMDEKFRDNVPLPPNWGGYLLKPEYFEFWQGRLNRLHDRICYAPDKSGRWEIKRLAP